MKDAPMPRPDMARPFTVLDAMILVGALAVGMGSTRLFDPDHSWRDSFAACAPLLSLFDQVAPVVLMTTMPTAVVLSLTVLALRLRKPRPHWRRLARQPGLVAGLASVLAWMVALVFTIVNVLSNRRPVYLPPATQYVWDPMNYLLSFTFAGSILAGFAVVVAWSTLALLGRWRPEPTWLDRAGRLLGLGWIMMLLAAWCVIRAIAS